MYGKTVSNLMKILTPYFFPKNEKFFPKNKVGLN